ncbi:MAG: helix-hairpin-helix domain-containing protein [Planctomycetota bacterium]
MRRDGGVALIVALWILAALTLLLYAFLGEMGAEYSLAQRFADDRKAEQLAWSAIDLAAATVLGDPKPWQELSDPWADDELRFFEFPLGEGAVTVMRPSWGDDPRMFWGLDDEASKVNLNTAPKEMLLLLPGVTEEIADSILDWRDPDSTPGPNGAEDGYYLSLDPPYRCKNGPFETVEELLYVRGMTPEILYGRDANRNGLYEKHELEGNARPDPPLFWLVTVWSRDRNVTLEGAARVNLNTAGPDDLGAAGFNPAEVQRVLGYRAANGGFPSVAHLLDVLSPERFRQVADRVTVWPGEEVPGLVNVNTASREVLRTLPGITDDLALKLLARRASGGEDLSNLGWLLEDLGPAGLKRVANLVTVRSYQFRIHAVGRVGTPYGTDRGESGAERPGAFRRMLAVFDRSAAPAPRVVYWADWTRHGMPYDPAAGPEPRGGP